MELCLSCTPMSWHRRILPATRLYCSCCTDIHCPFERRGTEQPNSWRSERIRVTMEFAMMCITRHFLVPFATKLGDDLICSVGHHWGQKNQCNYTGAHCSTFQLLSKHIILPVSSRNIQDRQPIRLKRRCLCMTSWSPVRVTPYDCVC